MASSKNKQSWRQSRRAFILRTESVSPSSKIAEKAAGLPSGPESRKQKPKWNQSFSILSFFTRTLHSFFAGSYLTLMWFDTDCVALTLSSEACKHQCKTKLDLKEWIEG